jgi:hypothetical protein
MAPCISELLFPLTSVIISTWRGVPHSAHGTGTDAALSAQTLALSFKTLFRQLR